MLPLSYGAVAGTRVSFDRSGYWSVAWRLSISGGGTPVRPRGRPNDMGYFSRKPARRASRSARRSDHV